MKTEVKEKRGRWRDGERMRGRNGESGQSGSEVERLLVCAVSVESGTCRGEAGNALKYSEASKNKNGWRFLLDECPSPSFDT